MAQNNVAIAEQIVEDLADKISSAWNPNGYYEPTLRQLIGPAIGNAMEAAAANVNAAPYSAPSAPASAGAETALARMALTENYIRGRDWQAITDSVRGWIETAGIAEAIRLEIASQLRQCARYMETNAVATLLETLGDLIYRATVYLDATDKYHGTRSSPSAFDQSRAFKELSEAVVNARRLDNLGSKLARVCDDVERSATAERVRELEAGLLRIRDACFTSDAVAIVDELLPEAARAQPLALEIKIDPRAPQQWAAGIEPVVIAGLTKIAETFSTFGLDVIAKARQLRKDLEEDGNAAAVAESVAFNFLERAFDRNNLVNTIGGSSDGV